MAITGGLLTSVFIGIFLPVWLEPKALRRSVAAVLLRDSKNDEPRRQIDAFP
jgi:hypothetical protein